MTEQPQSCPESLTFPFPTCEPFGGIVMALESIGRRRYGFYGLSYLFFYRCTLCGQLYPWVVSMTPSGCPMDEKETDGPYCNGRPITQCLCEERLPNHY